MPKLDGERVHAVRFHSLSDPTRLRILDLLRSGERCVCELMEDLGLAQSLLSFHLKTLRQAGLVTDRRQGRWTYYTLNPDGLQAMATALNDLAAVPRQPRARRRGDVQP